MELLNRYFLKILIFIVIALMTNSAFASGEYDCVFAKGFPQVITLKNCINCLCVAEVLCKSQTGKNVDYSIVCPAKSKQCPSAGDCLVAFDNPGEINFFSTTKNAKEEFDFNSDSPRVDFRPTNPVKKLDLFLKPPALQKSSKK